MGTQATKYVDILLKGNVDTVCSDLIFHGCIYVVSFFLKEFPSSTSVDKCFVIASNSIVVSRFS